MIKFENPEYLNFLFAIPVLIGVFVFVLYLKRKHLREFANSTLHPVLWGNKSFVKESVRGSLVIFAIALLILAVANPQTGSRIEEVKQKGIDVFILLDVSNSMRAEDIEPNRLDKAKMQISQLIRRLQGDRIGLIIFAGDAFIQFPLTTDYSAANLFLNAVDFNSIPKQGTALAAAINLAMESFEKDSPVQKTIVVITDGEDHEGDIDEAIKNANENNVKLFAIGMGTPDGAPIPNAQGGYKVDSGGQTVISKLDQEMLKKISSGTGAKYFLTGSSQNELDLIYNELEGIQKSEFGSRRITEYEDKYYYFLFPALLLLLIEFVTGEKRSSFVKKLLSRI